MENGDQALSEALENHCSKATAVFATIKLLDELYCTETTEISPQVLLAWLAYTNDQDLWCPTAASQAVDELIRRHREQLIVRSFTMDTVLKGFIKPLFSGARPSAVTPQGRKAINGVPIYPHHETGTGAPAKPWISEAVHVTTVFWWVIRHMDVSLTPGYDVSVIDLRVG